MKLSFEKEYTRFVKIVFPVGYCPLVYVTIFSVLLKRTGLTYFTGRLLRSVCLNAPHMRYRFILAIPLMALLASCQPVNRNKTTPSVAVETPKQPTTDSQPAGGNTLQQTVPGK